MTEPLVSELRYLVDTMTSKAVLNSTWEPSKNTDQYATKLLQQMVIPDSVKDLPINLQQHTDGWKKAERDNLFCSRRTALRTL